jgi:acyl carrier protein
MSNASVTTLDQAIAKATEWQSMTARVKDVIVTRLDLPIPADWVTDDQPLFGRGLELDSLDALELSMAVDQEFGTPLYEENTSLFGSVSAFLSFMLTKRDQLAAKDEASAAATTTTESTEPVVDATVPELAADA